MSYIENLWLFLVLLIGIIVVPGMDMMFVLANALTGGRRMGLAATLGIMAGGAAHTLFGAVGVGIVLKLVPWLFSGMLVAGAAYMAWIGVSLVRSSIVVGTVGPVAARSLSTAFRQGAMTCLLNPKAYLFTMAVYPQFLKPQYGVLWVQALTMGIMTVLTQFGIYGGLALAAGRSRHALVSRPRATMLLGRSVGLILVAAAILTVWHGWRLA